MGKMILAIDPSGNFDEGKGMTGWCLYDHDLGKVIKFGVIKATHYNTPEEYWIAHLNLIDGLQGYFYDLVVEDYRLYANRANSQINSRFETPKLIGIIQCEAFQRHIPIYFQSASTVKTRWSDENLVRKGIIRQEGDSYFLGSTCLVDHIRDAIRHAVHFGTFRKKDNND